MDSSSIGTQYLFQVISVTIKTWISDEMQMQMCFIEGLIPSALSLFSVQLIKPVHVTHFPQTKFTLDMPYIFDESKDGGRP